jgi:YD repeat-containing protein
MDATGQITTTVYFNDDLVRAVIDPEGHATSYAYDATHRQIAVMNAEGAIA